MGIDVVLDLDNRRDRVMRVAEEFKAHRAHMRGHAMQDESGRSDDAVGSLLLHARQAGQELVGYILAKASLAEPATWNVDVRFLDQLLAVGRIPADAETGPF